MAAPCCERPFVLHRAVKEDVSRTSDNLSVSVYRYEKSKELPATTDGEWLRRHSLQSHKEGPETIPCDVLGVFQGS